MRLILLRLLIVVSLAGLAKIDSSYAAAPENPTAEDLVTNAKKAYDAERFSEALEGFLKAHEKSNAPILLYPIARCYEGMEEPQKAAVYYERFLAEATPEAGVRGKAEMALRLLNERLAVGTLVLQVAPFGAEVVVASTPRGRAPIDPLELAPGTHEVVVSLEGHETSKQTVEVMGAKTVTIVVALEKAVATGPVGMGPDDPTIVKKTDDSGSSMSPWTWVTLSAGLAAAVGGGVAYWLGEQDHVEITEAEGYGSGELVDMTREEALALEASGDDKKAAGTILLAVGGAAVVTSAILFLLDGGGDSNEGSTDLVGSLSVGSDGAALYLGGRF